MPEGCYAVKKRSLNEIKELATAKAWVDSNMKIAGFHKRKGQLYVQTWHGSYGLKKIGLDLSSRSRIDIYDFSYNISETDIMVSNSRRTSDIYRTAFGYNGSLIEKGSPRNDVFFAETANVVDHVKEKFNVNGKRIALYAPTFRSDYDIEKLSFDYKKVISALSKATGDEWVLFLRLHYKNLNDAEIYSYENSHIINASYYDNMQELLVAADILITDYSSCMFDFITIPKPCFIYAPDLEKYEQDRGNYYKMSELPFPLAQNNEQLIENIENFKMECYKKKVKDLHERVGLCETGHASEAVADYIIDFIEAGKKK